MMLSPYIAAVQIGQLQIQSTYTRPVTAIVETAPEPHNPILNQEELDKIIKHQKPIEPLKKRSIAKLKAKPVPKPKVAQRVSKGANSGYYQPGWCTYGAWLLAPWVGEWGDAKFWDNRAKAEGYTVSNTPVVGSVFVDNNGYYGHVGFIQDVVGNSVVTKEMNFEGFGVWSSRTVPASSFVYIY